MSNLNTIINEFFNILEEIGGIKYTSRFNRVDLVEALSQTHIPMWKYMGFKERGGLNILFRKYILADLAKPKSAHWDKYIIYLMGYRLCTYCGGIKKPEYFYINRNICKECKKEHSSSYYKKHKDNIIERSKKYRENNIKKCKISKHNYYLLNSEKIKANSSARDKRVKQATVGWSETKEIVLYYLNRPEGYHVDHIIPIKHDLVCGLHVIDNLQYLTATENLIKGNKFIIKKKELINKRLAPIVLYQTRIKLVL